MSDDEPRGVLGRAMYNGGHPGFDAITEHHILAALRQVEQRAYEDAARVALCWDGPDAERIAAQMGGISADGLATARVVGAGIATAIRARSPLIRESTKSDAPLA